MDLNRLRTRRYTPTFNGNRDDDESLVVIHRTLRRSWAVNYIDYQEVIKPLSETAQDEAATTEARKAAQSELIETAAKFRLDFLKDHVTAVEGFKDGEKDLGLTEFFALCDEESDLGQEVLDYISSGSEFTEDDSKN